MRRVSLALAIATCAVASVAYLGAVPPSAMWGYVFVSVMIASVAALGLGQPHQWPALVAAAVPVVVWSTIVNTLSGETSGPAARSSAVCGLATVVAAHGARRGRTDLFAGGVVWLISGAMLYGAAGEVVPVIVVATVLALCAIFAITFARHQLTLSKWGAGALLFALASFILLVFVVVALSALVPSLINNRNSVVSTALRDQTIDFRPNGNPPTQPPTTTTRPPTTTTQPATPTTQPKLTTTTTRLQQGTEKLNRTILIVVVALVLLLVVLGLARIWWVKYQVKRWREKLESLPARDAIAGAWAWLNIHLIRWRWPIPNNFNVETAHEWAVLNNWPEPVQNDVQELSNVASVALFARTEPSVDQIVTSWELSDRLIASTRPLTPRWKRFVALFEGPER